MKVNNAYLTPSLKNVLVKQRFSDLRETVFGHRFTYSKPFSVASTKIIYDDATENRSVQYSTKVLGRPNLPFLEQ